MQVTVTNWHGAPVERGGLIFPARATATVEATAAQVEAITKASRFLEIHDPPAPDSYCPECDRHFASAQGLAQHTRMVHAPEKNEAAEKGDEEPPTPHEKREPEPQEASILPLEHPGPGP